MAAVGHTMDSSLKETSQGGIAVSPTGLAWAKKIFASS